MKESEAIKAIQNDLEWHNKELKPAYKECLNMAINEARLQAIKDIASASCVDIKDADNIANFCDEIYSAIPNLDNVVKELEKESYVIMLDGALVASKEIVIDAKRAIEIVRHGYVYDDCCEWKIDGDMAINPHNLSRYKIKQYDGLYALDTCQHCRKKIKVVE